MPRHRQIPPYVRMVENQAISEDIVGSGRIARAVGLTLARYRALAAGAEPTIEEFGKILAFVPQPAAEMLRLTYPDLLPPARRPTTPRRPVAPPQEFHGPIPRSRVVVHADIRESLRRTMEELQRAVGYMTAHADLDKKLKDVAATHRTLTGLRKEIAQWRSTAKAAIQGLAEGLEHCDSRLKSIATMLAGYAAATNRDLAELQEKLVAAQHRRATSLENAARVLRAKQKTRTQAGR